MNRRQFLLASGATAFAAGLRPATAATPVGFNDLYVRDGQLTETLIGLGGSEIEMTGYMAPPLKAEADFFVLTRTPMAVCPFCGTELEWPDDIVFVRTPGIVTAVPFNRPIRVRGMLDLGFETDADTGFVSLIRIEHASVERV